LEATTLQTVAEPRYSYLLQAVALAKLANCIAPKGSVLQWLQLSLGPLGFDVTMPSCGGEAVEICRDIPSLSRVSMAEVDQARSKRTERLDDNLAAAASSIAEVKEARIATITMTQAAKNCPIAFDPLMANASGGSSASMEFRAGLPLATTARSLAMLLASHELREDLDALGALAPATRDPTALGWFLTGGATQWTAGGLQTLEVAPRSLVSAPFARRQTGYGVVCGLGPTVAHFPPRWRRQRRHNRSDDQ